MLFRFGCAIGSPLPAVAEPQLEPTPTTTPDTPTPFVPVGELETNEEMGEEPTSSYPNDASWASEAPKEPVDLAATPTPASRESTLPAANTAAACAAVRQPLGALPVHLAYLRNMIRRSTSKSNSTYGQ